MSGNIINYPSVQALSSLCPSSAQGDEQEKKEEEVVEYKERERDRRRVREREQMRPINE